MFGFPAAAREVFPTNFLRLVEFHLMFNPTGTNSNLKELAISHFAGSFPHIEDNNTQSFTIGVSPNANNGPTVQIGNSVNGVKLLSSDRSKTLIITNNAITYRTPGNQYISFSDMKNELSGIIGFLQSIQATQITQLKLQKINIFSFTSSSNRLTALKDLISPELVGNIDYYPESDHLQQNMHSLIYKKDGHQLSLNYGLAIAPPGAVITGQVVVDITLVNIAAFAVEDFWTEAEKINSIIFDSFCWTISERAKQLLRARRN